jgi:hypothetical protein
MDNPFRPARLAIVVVTIAGLVAVGSEAVAASTARVSRVHSDATFTYLNGQERSFVADHGTLSDIGETSITVMRVDGVDVTLATSADTCVHVDGLPAELSNLVLGQDVVAIGDGTGTDALSIRAGHPKVKRGEPGCGLLARAVHGDITDLWSDGSVHQRSWDRGRITALTPHRIRIRRADGVDVVSHRTRLTRVVGAASYWRLRLGERVTVVSAVEESGTGESVLVALVIRVHRR